MESMEHVEINRKGKSACNRAQFDERRAEFEPVERRQHRRLCEDELFERVDLYLSTTHGAEDAAAPILFEDSEIDIIGVQVSSISRPTCANQTPAARRPADRAYAT